MNTMNTRAVQRIYNGITKISDLKFDLFPTYSHTSLTVESAMTRDRPEALRSKVKDS